MADIPSMQAAVLDGPKLPFKLTSVPRPQLAPGQALVKSGAGGVNPLDTKIRAGKPAHARHPLPAIRGIDLAGTVEAVAPDVTTFRPGDDVYGMPGGVGGVQGSLAEYAAVDAALLARKPANLTMREAAALPLIVITAWEGLVDRARVHAGQKVLIHAGGGGVGHGAIQIGRTFATEVFATASARKKKIVEEFAATAIDYQAKPVAAYVAEHTQDE